MVICHTTNNCSTDAINFEVRLLLDKIIDYKCLLYPTIYKYLEKMKETICPHSRALFDNTHITYKKNTIDFKNNETCEGGWYNITLENRLNYLLITVKKIDIVQQYHYLTEQE